MQDADVTHGKIELNIGDVSFTGEGNQDWLDSQITKVIEAIGSGQIGGPSRGGSPSTDVPETEPLTTVSLATYLKDTGGDSSQAQRFLATAGWLKTRGEKKLTTSLISRAIRDNQQSRLSNPSDCLNRNVSKGHCEKNPDGSFYVTPEGLKQLGEER